MSYEMAGIGDDTVWRVISPIRESRGWMKFLAILLIISGVLVAISIVGLIIAWLPIWIGVLLYQSADRAQTAYEGGSEGHAVESLSKLKTIFIIYGISTIVWLSLYVIFIVIVISANSS